MKELVGKKISQKAKFMGVDIEIHKLSVSEVMLIQAKAKDVEGDDTAGFALLKTVIQMSAEGATELTDADFDSFPMDELSKLSDTIMKFSGLAGDSKGK